MADWQALDLRDRDLISIQEARELVGPSRRRTEKIRGIFPATSGRHRGELRRRCADAAEPLARRAVEETGFGNVPDKTMKNTLAAVDVPRGDSLACAPSA